MSQILGLKFRDHGQVYYFDSGPFVVAKGDHVLVQTEQGMGLGRVFLIREDVPPEVQDAELKKIFRLADEEDLNVQRDNEELARRAFRFCRERISSRQMDMKLVDVEVYFDRGKIVFFFTAPGRIDFRELVKDLVREYRTRIELRQIGVRHETQMIGALGNCGQVCCCRRFMRKFAPVTIKMAKEQNLFLNPTKISGMCGRLLCCLSFEQDNYEEFHRRCPKIGKRFQTKLGMVRTLRANLFTETLAIQLESGEEREIKLSEWKGLLEVETGEAKPGAPAPRLPARRQEEAEPRGEEALAVLGESLEEGVALAEAPALELARVGGGDRPVERQFERSAERTGDRRERRNDRRDRRPDGRDARPKRPDRPEGPERGDRDRRREGGERADGQRGERRERYDRPERPDRTDRPDRADRQERAERADQPADRHVERPGDRPGDRPERQERTSRPERHDRTERSGERSDRPQRGDGFDRSGRAEHGDRTARSQRFDRGERSDAPEGRRERRERPDGQREQGRRHGQPPHERSSERSPERSQDRSQERGGERSPDRPRDERRGQPREERAGERPKENPGRLSEASAERFVDRLEDELRESRAELAEAAQAAGEGEERIARARRRRRKKFRPRESGQE